MKVVISFYIDVGLGEKSWSKLRNDVASKQGKVLRFYSLFAVLFLLFNPSSEWDSHLLLFNSQSPTAKVTEVIFINKWHSFFGQWIEERCSAKRVKCHTSKMM